MAVNGDHCYNFGKNPCQDNFVDLEHLDRSVPPSQYGWGDTSEARVAAALFDLYDYTPDGYDRMFTGFASISQIALGGTWVTSFQDFWNHWIGNGQNSFLSGLTLWWNTINYINIRQDYMPTLLK